MSTLKTAPCARVLKFDELAALVSTLLAAHHGIATPSVMRLSRYVRVPYRRRLPTTGSECCASRLLDELGWSLRVRPVAPHRAPGGIMVLAVEPLPAWEPWLGMAA